MNIFGSQRRVLLDVLMVCWGLGTWLGVNGVFVQLPLLVQRLPEGWTLPSFMSVAIQLSNVGVVIYLFMKKMLPRVSDALYIYALIVIGSLALFLNAFLHAETAFVSGTERSVPFLTVVFFTGLVGCTSSVLFYPYLRHFREVYLPTYLVGEGLTGLLPGVLALVQGIGGEPECVYSPDNTSVEVIFPEPRFDSTVFLSVLGCISTASLLSFGLLNNLPTFQSERVTPPESDKAEVSAKDHEAKGDEVANSEGLKEDKSKVEDESLLRPSWIRVMVLMVLLNATMNGMLPAVQSFSTMPYGVATYHLAVTLGAMANPLVCLAGVWLQPVRGKVLAAMLAAGLVPLAYMLTTALLSPTPPLHTETIGRVLIVATWVSAYAVLSYARLWVYGFARRGGGRGMRVCGVINQIGSLSGAFTFFFIVNFTDVFVAAPQCSLPPL